jgi:integral membrane protein
MVNPTAQPSGGTSPTDPVDPAAPAAEDRSVGGNATGSDHTGSEATGGDSLGAAAGRVVLSSIGWGGTERSLSPRSMRAALLRYRIMAYIVGTGLIILACIGVPLQYAGHNDTVVAIVGPIHGFAYIIYLAVAYDMARRVRWPITKLIPVVLAGLVPGVAFIVERWTTPRIQAAIDEAFAIDAPTVGPAAVG